MEQEVKVTIHRSEPAEPAEETQHEEQHEVQHEVQHESQHEANIPEQLRELSETISDTFSCFRESDSYEWLLKKAEKAKDYIKQNPTPAILASLGAGALFGLFIKKRR
jgi:hypothetical protein